MHAPADPSRNRFSAVWLTFGFWWAWLLVVTAMLIAIGLAIALLPDSRLLALHTSALKWAYFAGSMPEPAAQLRRFLLGPLGATIAGYFLLQLFVVLGPFRRRERWAWHAVLWPMLLWFVVDSAMSAFHGALFNVWMVNVWTLLLVGLPLVMTRRAFDAARGPEA